ncbi:MAG: hypothetical protein RBT46_07470 [Weeksellaceae bacterium]|jgi:hypothetical protein|nr:hypothetical protein [Weeksellaceae bacterium]MDX9705529.1 hypothetical protein [Weeksellaceae bacterium]
MTFAKRLRFYLIGFSLGVVVVVFFFGPRSMQCSYFPNSRALEEAKLYPISYSESAKEAMETNQIDSIFLYKEIFKKSVITNFGTDEVRAKPCRIYRAEFREEAAYDIVFELCDKKTIISEFKKVE